MALEKPAKLPELFSSYFVASLEMVSRSMIMLLWWWWWFG